MFEGVSILSIFLISSLDDDQSKTEWPGAWELNCRMLRKVDQVLPHPQFTGVDTEALKD